MDTTPDHALPIGRALQAVRWPLKVSGTVPTRPTSSFRLLAPYRFRPHHFCQCRTDRHFHRPSLPGRDARSLQRELGRYFRAYRCLILRR